MRLTVIGSSPSWPNPGSAHSGYLLESGDTRLLLDCGPGVLARLRSRGLDAVDAVAVTHFHLDHWGDLVPWAWLSTHGPNGLGRPRLLLPRSGLAHLQAFAARFGRPGMFERAFELVTYEAKAPFDVGAFRVEALPVAHFGAEAFGFRVVSEGRTLAYSGDSGPCEALRRLAAGVDLLLCEATLGSSADDGEPRGHLTAEEALSLTSGRILLTHRPAELGAPPGAEVAWDGLELVVG